jgi:zinc transporter, ZIP family
MDTLSLAFIGGLISAITTSLGSVLAPLFSRIERLRRYHLRMDFALGVMLSAVAFSLVGPELVRGMHIQSTLAGLLLGMAFIFSTHQIIARFQSPRLRVGKILLISTLIFHNFPEGMGAGASLAGMGLDKAIPIQFAISIQNIAEGLLLTLLLQGLGASLFWAVMGGIASGLLEMSGALSAGLLLDQTQNYLPFLLAFAGGSMMMSVITEVLEGLSLGRPIERTQFIYGLSTIPLTNLILN